MSVSLVLCAVGWAMGVALMWRLPGLRAATTASEGPVTVVVPARNEVDVLPLLLADLAADGWASTAERTVVVVDDHSTDGTADAARRHPFVEVVPAPALPAGWTGKNWACHTGAAAHRARHGTRGSLVFLDADVRLAPGALERVLGEGRRRGGLVSVQPWHEVDRPYERLSAIFNLVAIMGLGAATPGADGRASGGSGPVMCTTASDYATVGGHESVRGEVVEDLALGGRYLELGLPVFALGGRPHVRFRMYPQGLRALVDGWTKNFASGAGSTPATRLIPLVWWIVALISTAATAGRSLLGGPMPLAVWATAYVAFAGQLWWMLRRVGRFGPALALAYPVLAAAFVVVFARSLYRLVVRREVAWRGRTIAVGVRHPDT